MTLIRIAILALIGFVSGCGAGVGDSCQDHDDCGGDLFCSGPNEPQVCGIGPMEACGNDADCFGSICHAIADGCSGDGVGSQCDAPCSANSCGPNFRCNASQACESTPCDEGTACGPHQQCVPPSSSLPVHARTSGCSAIACGGDDDCPGETVCVNDICQERPGSCREEEIIP